MSPEDRLMELLVRWEESRQQGQEPSIEELCAEDPSLTNRLIQRIEHQRRIHRFLGLEDRVAETFPPSVDTPSNVRLNPSSRDDPETLSEIRKMLRPALGPDEIGRLGNYRLLKVLGWGGMGVVFEAEDTQLRRKVAVKAMLPALAAKESARKRFLREAQLAAALDHDHIVPIHQVGEDNNIPFLAMPLLAGESLETRYHREGPLPYLEVLRISRETAEGLAAAHARGLVHRDIKPANIYLEARKEVHEAKNSNPSDPPENQAHACSPARVKVLDFGLARFRGDDSQISQQGAVVGTPAYMAPEQARGEAVDTRCDLFSLGCVLYLISTGQAPYRGKDTISLLLAMARDEPTAPNLVKPDLPEEFSSLVMQLLAKDPQQRPVSAGEVVKHLQRLADGWQESTLKGSAPSVPPFEKRQARGYWRRRLGAAIVLFVAVGIVSIFYGTTLLRIAANQGEVVIEGNEHVKVTLMKGGKEAHVLDTKSMRTFVITAGDYEASIVEQPEGIRVISKRLSLERGGQVVLKVHFEPTPIPKEPPDPCDRLSRDQIDPWEFAEADFHEPGQRLQDIVAILGESRWNHWATIYDATYSPDGKLIATASADGYVRVLESTTGKRVWRFSGLGHSVAFSPDQRLLALAGSTNGVFVWDLERGQQLWASKALHPVEVVFTHDGLFLALFDREREPHKLHLANPRTGRYLESLPGHSGNLTALVAHPKLPLLASAATDGTVCLWDTSEKIAKGVLLQKVLLIQKDPKKRSGKLRLAFHPQAPILATMESDEGGAKQVLFWNVNSGEQQGTIDKLVGIRALSFNHDGSCLILTHDTHLEVHDLVKKKNIFWKGAHGPWFGGGPRPRMVHPDGKTLLSFRGTRLDLWDLPGGNLKNDDTLLGGISSELRPLAWSPVGDKLALGLGHCVHLWDLTPTGLKLGASFLAERHIGSPFHCVRCLQFSSDGAVLATGSETKLQFWDVRQGKLMPVPPIVGNYVSLNLLPDGNTLVSSTHAVGKIQRWEFHSGKEISAWPGLAKHVLRPTLSPDSRFLAFFRNVKETSVVVWDLVGNKEHWAAPAGNIVTQLLFTRDSRFLISSGIDQPIKIWEVATGKLVRICDGPGFDQTCLALSPNGRMLATSGGGGRIALLDLENPRLFNSMNKDGVPWRVLHLGPRGGVITGLAFSPTGRYLATANGNGTAYIVHLGKETDQTARGSTK